MLAQAEPTRFFLHLGGTMDPQARDEAVALPWRMNEGAQRPSVWGSPSLGAVALAADGAFGLHLEDRQATDPTPGTYVTVARVFLMDADGRVAQDALGDIYYLAEAHAAFDHPGGRVEDADGWTDLVLPVNASDPAPRWGIQRNHGALTIPAGYRLLLEVYVEGGIGAPGVGAMVVAPAGDLLADRIVESGLVPQWVTLESPVPFTYDAEDQVANVTIRSRAHDTATAVDHRMGLDEVPVAWFRVDDGERQSWLDAPVLT